MGKFGRFAGGVAGRNKTEQAKFENTVKAEIEKQVKLLEEKLYAQYQKQFNERLKIVCDAVRRTYEQYQADTAAIALNKLDWGEIRINRFLDEWSAVYENYFIALTEKEEADFYREMLDRRLKTIFRNEETPKFEKRYEFLPEIKYTIDAKTNNDNEKESEENKQNGA